MPFVYHFLTAFVLALLINRVFVLRRTRPAALILSVVMVVLAGIIFRLTVSLESALTPLAYVLPNFLGAFLAISFDAIHFLKPKV